MDSNILRSLKDQAKQPALVQPFNLQVLDQVADEKSLIIAVGYMLRSSPAVVAAKRLMQEVRAGPGNFPMHTLELLL